MGAKSLTPTQRQADFNEWQVRFNECQVHLNVSENDEDDYLRNIS